MPVDVKLAKRTEEIPESEIRALLRYRVKYYFAGGKPSVFPYEAFSHILTDIALEIYDKLLEDKEPEVKDLFSYGPSEGISELRKVLADFMRRRDNIPLDPQEGRKNVFITTGSQQAIYGILDSLIDPGDVIVTSAPVYLAFVNPAVKLGARVVTVPTDLNGIIPEYVDKAIEAVKRERGVKPKLVYVVADSDNPKGTTLPRERRQALFDIVVKHGIYLYEDAAYREIQFRGEKINPIKSLDKDNEYVIYARTTSKEAAALRVGYVILPEKLQHAFLTIKGYMDLCTPVLIQRFLVEYYTKYFERVIGKVVEEYRKRYEAMAKGMDESFPPGERTDPTGGFFIRRESEKKDFDARRFNYNVAIPNDIAFVPGQAFYPPVNGYMYDPESDSLKPLKPKKNTIRLGYSFLDPDTIYEGIIKLGKLLQEHLK